MLQPLFQALASLSRRAWPHWLVPAAGPVTAGSVKEGDGVQRLAECGARRGALRQLAVHVAAVAPRPQQQPGACTARAAQVSKFHFGHHELKG